MKKILAILATISISIAGVSQNNLGKLDDTGRIILSPYIAPQSRIPASAANIIKNKLNQIVLINGIGGKALDSRFIITANVEQLGLEVTPTAPPMKAYTLGITLYVGDGIEGTLFSSASITVKGVGDTESKAYNAALKSFKTSDPAWQMMIEDGKKGIVAYYNGKIDFIIKEAQSLAATNNYEEAIAKLLSVPQICKEPYEKAMEELLLIYTSYNNYKADCLLRDAWNIWTANQDDAAADKVANLLMQIDPSTDKKKEVDALWANISCARFAKAKAIWSAGQDLEAAKKAAEILSKVNVDSPCFKDASALMSSIEKKVIQIDKREWDALQLELQRGYNLEKSSIEAAKAIGVAWGQNQQPQTYNIVTWW